MKISTFKILFLTAFIVAQGFAYEKSGFFVGIQGGIVSQEKTITNSYYNFDLEQKATGRVTVSGAAVSKKTTTSLSLSFLNFDPLKEVNIGIGGTLGEMFGASNSNNTSLKTTADSVINIAVNTFFSKDVEIITDSPYSIGAVLGYKKIFSSGLNSTQFVGNNLTRHASGLRYYVSIDASGSGKKSGYATLSANANLDFLYNLFPDHNFFDVGAFAGVSVGMVRHRTPIYNIQGVDYGLNFGIRWTIHEKHTIELYGRYGLSKLERRTKNTHKESYASRDLSSVAMNNSAEIDNGASLSGGSIVNSSGKIYIGDVSGSNTSGKKPVTIYYGADGNVYYKVSEYGSVGSKETLYKSKGTDSDGLHTFEVYSADSSTSGDTDPKYARAYAEDGTGTYYYYWTVTGYEDEAKTKPIKSIQLNSNQSTTGGGTTENVRTTTQVYKSYPIDTIEEFRNPIRFGIRYTYTF